MKYKYIKNALDFFHDRDKFNLFRDQYSKNKLFLNKQFNIKYYKKRILAIYDFADSPYTSDIVFFILNAEIERRKFNLEKIDIMFITNEQYPCNPNYQVIDNYKQLLYNFAIEFTRLFTFIGTIQVIDNRNQASDYLKNIKKNYIVFPFDYDIKFPFERLIDLKTTTYYVTNYAQYAKKDKSINCITAPKDQMRLARRWLLKNAFPKIPITITLRETQQIQSPRNSKINEWEKLIHSYDKEKYIFIILRDYYNLYDTDILVGDNVIYCNEASLSLSFRTALYQLTTLNLFVANGPCVVCLVSNNINYLEFKVVTNDSCAVPIEHYKKYYGFELGDNWYSATKYQKYIWEDDDFEVLKRETDSMLKLLDDDGKLYPDCYNQDFEYKEEENNNISYELYKEESLISQRTPLKYYVFVFKILELIKKTFKIGIYKSLYDIHIKQNDKLLLYGAGTITQSLIKKYKDNIIGVIDKDYNIIQNQMIHEVSIFPIKSLKELSFDYIIITPKLREYAIINELKEKFDIKNSKFLLGSKYD